MFFTIHTTHCRTSSLSAFTQLIAERHRCHHSHKWLTNTISIIARTPHCRTPYLSSFTQFIAERHRCHYSQKWLKNTISIIVHTTHCRTSSLSSLTKFTVITHYHCRIPSLKSHAQLLVEHYHYQLSQLTPCRTRSLSISSFTQLTAEHFHSHNSLQNAIWLWSLTQVIAECNLPLWPVNHFKYRSQPKNTTQTQPQKLIK